MKATGASKIQFYKHRVSMEPDEYNLYNLVRLDTLDALKVDKNVIELLRLLSKDLTLKEAAESINFSTHSTLLMLRILEEGHFIKSIDGEKLDDTRQRIKPEITDKSILEFHRLRISTHPDEHNLYAIVRWDTDDTLRVDKNVVELVKLIREGNTVSDAAREINFSMQVVDMILKMLDEANFFKAIDGVVLKDAGKKIKPWLPELDPKWLSWLLFKPLWYVLLFISGVSIITGLIIYGLPTYKSFFWTSDIFIVFVSLFIGYIIFTFLHESAHFLFTKAVGGEAVMRINYRYLYIVAETDSYHLGVVPKNMRYMVYLSGVMLDLVIIGAIYWILLIAKFYNIQLGSIYHLLSALVITQIISLLWQLNVFLETDLYNFLSEYLGIENLRNDVLKYIELHTKKWKKVLLFPVSRILLFFSSEYSESSDDLRMLHKSERRSLQIYIIVLVVGMFLITGEFILYTLPRDYIYLTEATFDLLMALKSLDFISVFKYLVIIILVSLNYILLLFLKNKEIIGKHFK